MPSSGKYVPPHLRGKKTESGFSSAIAPSSSSSFRNSKRFGPGKVVFFGDSFVRMFGLIEHPGLKVNAFKGATAKGLAREQNENRKKIVEVVQRASAERLIFLFGSVDVHLSYYYKKYTLKEGEIDLVEIANNYVDFVAALPAQANTTRTVLGLYPSPLEDDAVAPSLASMGSITEELIPTVNASDDSKLDARQARVQRFNQALRNRCQQCSIDYIDAFDDVLDPQKNIVKDIYRDVSDYNIHIVWETTMLMVGFLNFFVQFDLSHLRTLKWLEKWPWLKDYIAFGFEDKLRQTLKEYLKTKPWAERTHVTQAS